MADFMKEYTQDVHRHRVAVWAACRAASTLHYPFRVKRGREWLHQAQAADEDQEVLCEKKFLCILDKEWNQIGSQEDFDEWHHCRVTNLRDTSTEFLKKDRCAPYGIAAKLLNVYLKIYFLGEISSAGTGKFSYVHPPLDSILLDRFRRIEGPGNLEIKNLPDHWTRYEKTEYKHVINVMRRFATEKKQPLWKIEAYWTGFRK